MANSEEFVPQSSGTTASTSEYHDGFEIFKPLADLVGGETDQINFVICVYACLPIAYFYNKFLPPCSNNRQSRALVSMSIGLFLCYFCFGSGIKHLLGNAIGSYMLMQFCPPEVVHTAVMTFSMGYLLVIHFYRWLMLTEFHMDMTGPLMIIVQKTTTMAFSLHDGRARARRELTKQQRAEAIDETPGFDDYCSYIFNFQTVLCGPLNFYTHYDKYLEGKHAVDRNGEQIPIPFNIAVNKAWEAFFYLIITASFSNVLKPHIIGQEDFLQLPYYQWAFWWYFTMFIYRTKYYFAWTIADSICNMSGFGFKGYDTKGDANWSLLTNVFPYKVESALSFKDTIDSWNVSTAAWLKRTAYDRTDKSVRTVYTYVLSATWHGFSAGYYITFLTGALATMSANTVRRYVRWRVVDNPTLKFAYDMLTFVSTKIAISYAAYGLVVMDFYPSYKVYRHAFFSVHIIMIILLYGTPMFLQEKPRRSAEGSHLTKGKGAKSKRSRRLRRSRSRSSNSSNSGSGSSNSNHSGSSRGSLTGSVSPGNSRPGSRTGSLQSTLHTNKSSLEPTNLITLASKTGSLSVPKSAMDQSSKNSQTSAAQSDSIKTSPAPKNFATMSTTSRSSLRSAPASTASEFDKTQHSTGSQVKKRRG